MLVAVTATSEPIRGAMRVRLNESYTRALETVGLVPLLVPPLHDAAAAARALDAVGGLLLTGGEDVGPANYGASPHPRTGEPHARRDATELALARAAAERRMPTLAICRGVQLFNVALGGSRVPDRPRAIGGPGDHDPQEPRHQRTHAIDVDAPSRLATIFEAAYPQVNSIHHQALDRVAPPLRVSARASDGTIEAVESIDPSWWALGVQWHPEELVDDEHPWDRRLFAAFTEAVGRR
jgi:putative glutamine amidotransferase